jgi:hypothetical protein
VDEGMTPLTPLVTAETEATDAIAMTPPPVVAPAPVASPTPDTRRRRRRSASLGESALALGDDHSASTAI